MMKQDAQRWNDCKNKIFVFDAYGKLFKIIDVSQKSTVEVNFLIFFVL